MGSKKKAKSSSTAGSNGGKTNLKKSKSKSTGKQVSVASTNNKTTEGDSVTYGVVPSEYNIQAQIDWLTAPPSSGDKKSANNAQPPPSKKPQRGFHHDVCDGCGEGECLMYCDKCPAAYHCICDHPPLPPEDYETLGVNWKCRRCRNMVKIKTEIPDEEDVEEVPTEDSKDDGPIKSIFKQLIPLANVQNPVQFKLSKEYPAYEYPFPGTSRHVLKKARQRTSVVEVENGIVPKPTVVCFHCQLSCRVGALIQCDKCNMFFHLDCLDPPLTTIPTTVWICPLHMEPHLESTQLTSVALSERIKIWERGEAPVNRTAVILNFMRKAKRPNPMFRRKRPIPMLTKVKKVPDMVIRSYENRVNLPQERFGSLNALACVCEVEKLNFEMKLEIENYREKVYNEYLPMGKALVDQRAKLDFLRTKNMSKLEHLRNLFEVFGGKTELQSSDVTSSGPSLSKAPKMLEAVKDIATPMDVDANNEEKSSETKSEGAAPNIPVEAELPESVPESLDGAAVETKVSNGSSGVDCSSSVPQWILDELMAAETDIDKDTKILKELEQDIRRAGEILKGRRNEQHDDIDTLKADQVCTPHIVEVPTTNIQNTQSIPIPEATLRKLKEKVSTSSAADIIKWLPRKVISKLAARHMENLMKKKNIKEFMSTKSKSMRIGLPEDEDKPKVQLLLQIENTGLRIEMTKQVFSIGSSDTCDLKLTDYIKCNRIDDVHAKMFFNPLENCFEILNYSSTGITVNSVRFGLGTMETQSKSAATSERHQEIEKMVDANVEDYIKSNQDSLSNIAKAPCFCRPFPEKSLPKMFEGSIKLNAGLLSISGFIVVVKAFELVRRNPTVVGSFLKLQFRTHEKKKRAKF